MARSLPQSGARERFFILGQAPGLTHKHQNRLRRLVGEKHSSLLRTFVNYGHKKFCNIGPCTINFYGSNFCHIIISYSVCQCQSLPSLSNIWGRSECLVRGSTLVSLSFAYQYQTGVEILTVANTITYYDTAKVSAA